MILHTHLFNQEASEPPLRCYDGLHPQFIQHQEEGPPGQDVTTPSSLPEVCAGGPVRVLFGIASCQHLYCDII